MESLAHGYARVKRATAARTVLDTLAAVFLGCSLAFWAVLHFAVLYQPAPYIPQAIAAAVMTLVYALALPLLLSMLVPTTPAGQMLQKTQWRTFGFPIIIASAGFLGWHAKNLMLMWFTAQPAIAEAGQQMAYTIAALIGFVVIPALCWVQVTPERWLREINNAHAVRKLSLMQDGEIAILRERLRWAEARVAMSFANLLPSEQQEVMDTLHGLFRGISDQQRAIARQLGVSAEFERTMMGDDEIAERFDYVAQQLTKNDVIPARARTIAAVNPAHADDDRDGVAHVNTRSQSSIPRDARDVTRRQVTSGEDEYACAARDHFGVRPWTIKQLEGALEIGETKAREMKDAWLADGVVHEARMGRWYFTE